MKFLLPPPPTHTLEPLRENRLLARGTAVVAIFPVSHPILSIIPAGHCGLLAWSALPSRISHGAYITQVFRVIAVCLNQPGWFTAWFCCAVANWERRTSGSTYVIASYRLKWEILPAVWKRQKSCSLLFSHRNTLLFQNVVCINYSYFISRNWVSEDGFEKWKKPLKLFTQNPFSCCKCGVFDVYTVYTRFERRYRKQATVFFLIGLFRSFKYC